MPDANVSNPKAKEVEPDVAADPQVDLVTQARVMMRGLIICEKSAKDNEVSLVYTEPTTKGKLYLSSVGGVVDFQKLKAQGITRILTVARGLKCLHAGKEGVQTKLIKLYDSCLDNLIPHLPDIVSFVADGLDAGEGVLVHSLFGRSRAPIVCATVVMSKENLSLFEALRQIALRSKRDIQVCGRFIEEIYSLENASDDDNELIIEPLNLEQRQEFDAFIADQGVDDWSVQERVETIRREMARIKTESAESIQVTNKDNIGVDDMKLKGQLERLEKRKAEAVKNEDFELAATIRDQIEEVQSRKPKTSTPEEIDAYKQQLLATKEAAIKNDDFTSASKIRDELIRLEETGQVPKDQLPTKPKSTIEKEDSYEQRLRAQKHKLKQAFLNTPENAPIDVAPRSTISIILRYVWAFVVAAAFCLVVPRLFLALLQELKKVHDGGEYRMSSEEL